MDIFQKPRRLNGDQVPSPPISLFQTLMLPMSLFSRVIALPRRSLPSHAPLSHRVRDTPKNSSKHTCKCSRQSFSRLLQPFHQPTKSSPALVHEQAKTADASFGAISILIQLRWGVG
jgi:hypothetical protein